MPIHVEEWLLPHVEWLILKRVWRYQDLPGRLQSADELKSLKDYGWLESRCRGSIQWTADCDLDEWIKAEEKEPETDLEVRLSAKAVRRVDALALLDAEGRELWRDFLGLPLHDGQDGAGAGKGAAKNRKVGTKRKRTTELTERDKEILRTYSECELNAAATGRQLAISRKYVSRVVKKSKARYAKAGAPTRSAHAQQTLPTAKRGEPAVSEQAGTSDKGIGRRLRVKQKF